MNTSIPSKVLPALTLTLLFASAVTASTSDQPHRVLVLQSHRNSLPANTDWYTGIARGFTSAPDLRIEIDVEAPDLTRLGDADYVGELLRIYGHKYRDYRPDLIIPTWTPAFRFLLEHGEELFPGVPIVFCTADGRVVGAHKLPATMTGVTFNLDIAGTAELALALHPDTEQVAVIVGSGAHDRNYERLARQALQSLKTSVEFLWLKGMPSTELAEALSRLPPRTVILYLVQFEDRTGNTYIPRNVLRDIADVATVPTYGLWDTLIGTGIVGGRLVALEEDGFQAAQMGLRILGGEAPSAIPVVDREQNPAIFDGRQLARWNVDEDRLPAGSRILHRQPSVWDEHRTDIIAAVSVIVFQGLLIFALWLNRSRLQLTKAELQDEYERRIRAETAALGLRTRLTRFSKERTLGTMATAIAHEINQPLIAIQNYAEAAQRRLGSDVDQTPKLNELLEKIGQQAGRAGDIIQNIRTLVTTDDAELRPVPLNSLLEQTIQMMRPEVESQGCSLECEPAAELPAVLADTLQLQLVLVNLLQNAVCSMESVAREADKVATIDVHRINDREVRISVADRGSGVPPDRVENIFEPHYSDKSGGMGMGLAICRDIMEAHGGRLWYTPNPAGGAIFQFTLRVATG